MNVKGEWSQHYGKKTGDLARWLWYGLVACASMLIFSIAITQTLVVLLNIGWIVLAFLSRPFVFRRTPVDVPLLAFVFFRLLAIPLSVNPSLSLPALHVELFFYVLFVFTTNSLTENPLGKSVIIIKTLIVCGVAASLVGISRYMFGLTPRASSFTSGYYTLGIYLTVVLSIVLMSIGKREIFRHSWLWIPATLILSAGIILTQNRLHWIAMALLIGSVGVLKERKLLFVIPPLLLGLGFMLPDIAARFFQTLDLFSQSSGRDVLWRGAAIIWDQHPVFGHGLRTFREIFPLISDLPDKGISSWHNDYLQIYMESGMFGLLGIFSVIGTVYVLGFRFLRDRTNPELVKNTVVTILVALTVFFVVGGILDTLMSLLFKILLGLFAVLISATWSHHNVRLEATDHG